MFMTMGAHLLEPSRSLGCPGRVHDNIRCRGVRVGRRCAGARPRRPLSPIPFPPYPCVPSLACTRRYSETRTPLGRRACKAYRVWAQMQTRGRPGAAGGGGDDGGGVVAVVAVEQLRQSKDAPTLISFKNELVLCKTPMFLPVDHVPFRPRAGDRRVSPSDAACAPRCRCDTTATETGVVLHLKHPGTCATMPSQQTGPRAPKPPLLGRTQLEGGIPQPHFRLVPNVKIAYANSLQRCLHLPHFNSGLVWCSAEQYTVGLHMAKDQREGNRACGLRSRSTGACWRPRSVERLASKLMSFVSNDWSLT